MGAFNKHQVIYDIKLSLRRLQITHIVALMDNCGLPDMPKVGGFHDVYLPGRLERSTMHQLAALSAILKSKYGVGKPLHEKYRLMNDEDGFRLFVGHSEDQSDCALALKETFAQGGIDCFVAGDELAEAAGWATDIVAHLKHMNVLVALSSDSAVANPLWNQELGFALGSGKPVISVSDCAPPGGLVGAVQMIERRSFPAVKDLALEIISRLMATPDVGAHLTDVLVRQLVSCVSPRSSFKIIGFCRKALGHSSYLTAGQLFELRRAARENDEIIRFACGRGPELIETMCDEFEQRGWQRPVGPLPVFAGLFLVLFLTGRRICDLDINGQFFTIFKLKH